MSNIRYIVAYPSPSRDHHAAEKELTCDRTIYYYEWQAARAAQVIGGWVIPVDLRVNQVPEQSQP